MYLEVLDNFEVLCPGYASLFSLSIILYLLSPFIKSKKINSINTIKETLKLKKLYLYAKREDIKLEEGAHFIVDLIGLEVYTEEGKLLGKLKEVLQPGANDVYIVENENKEQILLPVIPDVIKNIDLQSKRIVVHLLEGLI